MRQRENFFAAMGREEPQQIPFFMRFCEEQEEEFYRIHGTRDYLAYYGSPFRPVKLNPTKNQNDYSMYFEGMDYDYYDEWGVGHKRGSCYHFEKIISPMKHFSKPAEVEQFPVPDILEDYRWYGIVEKIQKLKDKDFITMTASGCNIDIFKPAWYLRGLEELLMDMIAEEEMAEACLERMCRIKCKLARRCAQAGYDVIVFGDDVATQRGMMMSAVTWRTWLKPRLKRAITSAKEANPQVLCYYHSDGNITEIIEDLIEIGVDILNPIQPECMDPVKIKERFGGRVNLWGTLGTQTTMPFGTWEEVYRKTLDLCEKVGKGGGLVIAPTHLLEPEVPLANIEAFVEAVKASGRGI